jgi:hypothetical protein
VVLWQAEDEDQRRRGDFYAGLDGGSCDSELQPLPKVYLRACEKVKRLRFVNLIVVFIDSCLMMHNLLVLIRWDGV